MAIKSGITASCKLLSTGCGCLPRKTSERQERSSSHSPGTIATSTNHDIHTRTLRPPLRLRAQGICPEGRRNNGPNHGVDEERDGPSSYKIVSVLGLAATLGY